MFVRTSAREDVLRQYSYYLIEKDAPRAAERFLEAVQTAVEALCRTPRAGSPRVLEDPALAGLRSWPVSGFPALRIYYTHGGDELRILRILHGKRDIKASLEEEAGEEE